MKMAFAVFMTAMTCSAEVIGEMDASSDNLGHKVSVDDFHRFDFPGAPITLIEPHWYDLADDMTGRKDLFDLKAGASHKAMIIADVASVTPVGLSGLDACRFDDVFSKRVIIFWYRVHLLVRNLENGVFPLESFTTAVPYQVDMLEHGKWFYYRGMTLRCELARCGKNWIAIKACPVKPYGNFNKGIASPLVVGDQEDSGGAPQRHGLEIDYGDGVKVHYLPGEVLLCGKFGVFFDFNQTISIVVSADSSLLKVDYWRNAWFKPTILFGAREGQVCIASRG